MYDIIIIGGGPAGMTAGLYGARNGKSVLIIEKETFGGQMTFSPKIENYPGTISASGNDLAEQMLNQILNQNVEIDIDTVTNIEKNTQTGFFSITTETGTKHDTKTVIIANGVKHRVPILPHINDYIGNGISFCAVCDGDFYTNKNVCLIGGGNSALQEAILLSEKCNHLTILQDLDHLTGEEKLINTIKSKHNIDIITNTELDLLIIENNEITGIKYTDTTNNTEHTIPCNGIFVAIGLIPDNLKFRNIADLDGSGYFLTDETCITKTPGIFVAGDCRRKTIRQITTAIADGATAALNACSYLNNR